MQNPLLERSKLYKYHINPTKYLALILAPSFFSKNNVMLNLHEFSFASLDDVALLYGIYS